MLFLSSFILGIASSLHCLGMCGPLVLAVPAAKGRQHAVYLLLYLVSKALAYASMGAVIGILGLGFYLMEWQQWVSVISGILVILFVLMPFFHKISAFFPFRSAYQHLYKKMHRDPKWYHYMLLGYLNGFLPCGVVYAAMTTALVAGNVFDAGLAMFTFGLGTIPALYLLSVLKFKVKPTWRQKLKPVSMVLTIAVGTMLILRGMNLGIPYISPELHQNGKVECCH